VLTVIEEDEQQSAHDSEGNKHPIVTITISSYP
jgi:hypothetical protein